jgi:hypothetical protein
MKFLLKCLLIATVLIASGKVAFASSINGTMTFTGYASASSTGITFTNPEHLSNSGTGDFSGFDYPSNVKFTANFTFSGISAAGGESLYRMTSSDGTQYMTYSVTSYSISYPSNGGTPVYTFYGPLSLYSVDANGVGTLIGTTNATFVYTNSSSTTFSGALTTTPEPGSLLLLGTGLLAAAGMMFRKRRGALNLA